MRGGSHPAWRPPSPPAGHPPPVQLCSNPDPHSAGRAPSVPTPPRIPHRAASGARSAARRPAAGPLRAQSPAHGCAHPLHAHVCIPCTHTHPTRARNACNCAHSVHTHTPHAHVWCIQLCTSHAHRSHEYVPCTHMHIPCTHRHTRTHPMHACTSHTHTHTQQLTLHPHHHNVPPTHGGSCAHIPTPHIPTLEQWLQPALTTSFHGCPPQPWGPPPPVPPLPHIFLCVWICTRSPSPRTPPPDTEVPPSQLGPHPFHCGHPHPHTHPGHPHPMGALGALCARDKSQQWWGGWGGRGGESSRDVRARLLPECPSLGRRGSGAGSC